jgi:peroxiredoxin Q/BCP
MRALTAIGTAVFLMAVQAVRAEETGGTAAATELRVGEPAPDFELQASDGKTYRLADFRGKQAIVLAWYPKAFTRGCTLECKSLAEKGDLIRKFDVTYFMASVDALPENKGFAEQQKANFPLLSDPSKETAKRYGVLGPYGVAQRWTFYISKDGKLLAIDRQVNPTSSAEDIAEKLGALGVARVR